jgi:hypothetical protein
VRRASLNQHLRRCAFDKYVCCMYDLGRTVWWLSGR